MRMLRFLNLCLLSQNERRGLKIPFAEKTTVIRAGNGFGKSAIVKSLYEVFGAKPHKIDEAWRGAQVITVLEFTIDDQPYAIMKVAGSYTIFDADKHPLLHTSHVTKELGPYLANLLDFSLVMTDRKDEKVIPPPAYIFAPFYIDQDKGWSEPWSSFDKMYLPNSKRTLAEFHSGLKPNAYYEAQAERERLRVELRDVEAEQKALEIGRAHV